MSYQISTYFSMCQLARSGELVIPSWTGTALVPSSFAQNPFAHVGMIAAGFAGVLDGHGHKREEQGTVLVENRYDDDGTTGRYKLEYESGASPHVTATIESFHDNGRYVRVNYFGEGMAGSVMAGISSPEQHITVGQTYDPSTMMRGGSQTRPVPTVVRLSKASLMKYLGADDATSLLDVALLMSARICMENSDVIQVMQIQASDGEWHDLIPGELPRAVIDPLRFAIRSVNKSKTTPALEETSEEPCVTMQLTQNPDIPRDGAVLTFNYGSTPADTIPFGPSEKALFDHFGVWGTTLPAEAPLADVKSAADLPKTRLSVTLTLADRSAIFNIHQSRISWGAHEEYINNGFFLAQFPEIQSKLGKLKEHGQGKIPADHYQWPVEAIVKYELLKLAISNPDSVFGETGYEFEDGFFTSIYSMISGAVEAGVPKSDIVADLTALLKNVVLDSNAELNSTILGVADGNENWERYENGIRSRELFRSVMELVSEVGTGS